MKIEKLKSVSRYFDDYFVHQSRKNKSKRCDMVPLIYAHPRGQRGRAAWLVGKNKSIVIDHKIWHTVNIVYDFTESKNRQMGFVGSIIVL